MERNEGKIIEHYFKKKKKEGRKEGRKERQIRKLAKKKI